MIDPRTYADRPSLIAALEVRDDLPGFVKNMILAGWTEEECEIRAALLLGAGYGGRDERAEGELLAKMPEGRKRTSTKEMLDRAWAGATP